MRHRDYLDGLTQIHRLDDPDERLRVWRQSLATLGAAVADQRRSVPLEGFDPEELLASTEACLRDGLLDDVDFLSGPAGAAALYELAAALPPSDTKRELGRRVLAKLHQSDAATFVALATRLALGSRRALAGAAVRARVALALDLPIGDGARADGLALALISRRELSREWITQPSTGSLPSRRLAARLLERAAREAAQRAAEGDDSGVRVFETRAVREAWERLLSDRESLVWRHVAAARGLLSVARPAYAEEIERHLEEGLGITEWRRASASMAASIAVRRDALVRCREVLGSDIFDKDRGIAAAMVMGLPRAAESDPESVEELLEQLVRVGGLAAAEELVELRRERIGEGFGDWAARSASARLKDELSTNRSPDDGVCALTSAVIDELIADPEKPTLRDMIDVALDGFVKKDARRARIEALTALAAAEQKVEMLERCMDDEERGERQTAFRALRELDLAILESDSLANLLCLGARGDEPEDEIRPLGDLFQRMTNWLIIHEGNPRVETEVPHFVLRIRRLRSFLHLVDADGRRVDDRAELLRQRRLLTAQVLLARIADDDSPRLRRALCASAARACDALVREETCEVSDILIAAGRASRTYIDLLTMAEASMVPDLEAGLRAYAKLERAVMGADDAKGLVVRDERSVRTSLDALNKLAHDLPVATSPRVEALRHSLLDFASALEPLASCGSLHELSELSVGETPLSALEAATQSLAQLVSGARRRMGEPTATEAPSVGPAIRMIDLFLERTLREASSDLDESVASAAASLREEIPTALAEIALIALMRLPSLPLDAPRRSRASFTPSAPKEIPLPAWVPPSKTLGGFFLTRPIGTGAAGSVFIARRSDARHDPTAEQFALKTPDYSGAAARTLSEEEFLRIFREEAGALLALPEHENIARFVTFDAGARPKPILVMELVEGPNLERMLESKDLDMPRALDLLSGIAAGLEAMHGVGVAHLDLKPSNVIVRDPDGILGPLPPDAPVLVDFGLAGRALRPGCGTASYGAPEVWGHIDGPSAQAAAADVYAFGCLAFEMLTGRTLFEEANDLATITAHLQHDGRPELVNRLTTDPRTAGVAELIRRAIRRAPSERVDMGALRRAIARLRPQLEPLSWPIQLGG